MRAQQRRVARASAVCGASERARCCSCCPVLPFPEAASSTTGKHSSAAREGRARCAGRQSALAAAAAALSSRGCIFEVWRRVRAQLCGSKGECTLWGRQSAPAAAPAALLTCAAAKGAAVELCNKGRLRWAQLRLIYRLLESRFFWGRGDRWAGIPETRPRTCRSGMRVPPPCSQAGLAQLLSAVSERVRARSLLLRAPVLGLWAQHLEV